MYNDHLVSFCPDYIWIFSNILAQNAKCRNKIFVSGRELSEKSYNFFIDLYYQKLVFDSCIRSWSHIDPSVGLRV